MFLPLFLSLDCPILLIFDYRLSNHISQCEGTCFCPEGIEGFLQGDDLGIRIPCLRAPLCLLHFCAVMFVSLVLLCYLSPHIRLESLQELLIERDLLFHILRPVYVFREFLLSRLDEFGFSGIPRLLYLIIEPLIHRTIDIVGFSPFDIETAEDSHFSVVELVFFGDFRVDISAIFVFIERFMISLGAFDS